MAGIISSPKLSTPCGLGPGRQALLLDTAAVNGTDVVQCQIGTTVEAISVVRHLHLVCSLQIDECAQRPSRSSTKASLHELLHIQSCKRAHTLIVGVLSSVWWWNELIADMGPGCELQPAANQSSFLGRPAGIGPGLPSVRAIPAAVASCVNLDRCLFAIPGSSGSVSRVDCMMLFSSTE